MTARPDIQTVLFDADGVLQNPVQPIRQMLAALVDDSSDGDRFVEAVFAAERPCLTGEREFTPMLAALLEDWNSPATVDEALRVWTTIKPDEDILQLVRQLRRNGISVALATNQQRHRADFMKRTLGYEQIFDDLFYSCEMGLAKPDQAYFRLIARRLNLNGPDVLFLDDHPGNVEAARAVGMHAETFQIESGPAALRDLLVGYGIPVG